LAVPVELRPRTWRLFVSSPSDVPDERRYVSDVAERLNGTYFPVAGLDARIQVKLSDDVPAGGHPGGAQGLIEEAIPFTDYDFVVAIFWKRIGTPVDGFRSGTVREIESAYTASDRQRRRPRIMVYEKRAEFRRGNPDEMHQVHLLAQYLEEVQTRLGLWVKPFETAEEFSRKLMDDLYMVIVTEMVKERERQISSL
jgi:hypothetical protein